MHWENAKATLCSTFIVGWFVRVRTSPVVSVPYISSNYCEWWCTPPMGHVQQLLGAVLTVLLCTGNCKARCRHESEVTSTQKRVPWAYMMAAWLLLSIIAASRGEKRLWLSWLQPAQALAILEGWMATTVTSNPHLMVVFCMLIVLTKR